MSGQLAGKCEICGTPIHLWADVCERHAMSDAQLLELSRRIGRVQRGYYLELWPELASARSQVGGDEE